MDFWNNLFGFSLLGDTPKLRPLPKPAPQGMTWQLAPTRATAEMVAAWDAGMRSAQLSGCGHIEAIDVAYRQMLASAPRPTSEADTRQALIETEAERDLLRAQLNKLRAEHDELRNEHSELRAEHEALKGACSSLSSTCEEWNSKMAWAYVLRAPLGTGTHVADIAREAYEAARAREDHAVRNCAAWIEQSRKKDDKFRAIRKDLNKIIAAIDQE